MDPQQQQQQVTANAPFGPRNVTSIRSKLKNFERQIDGVQQKINSKQQQIRSKEGEIYPKEEEIRSKEEEIYPKEEEIRSKEEEIRSKEDEIRSKEDEIRSKQQQLDQFEQQTTEESNQSLRQLLSLERERSSLIYKVRSLERELASLERERSSLKDELASLTDKVRSLEREKSSLKGELASLNGELVSLNGELASRIKEQTMLGRSFTEGRYFAPLFDYWKAKEKNIKSNRDLSGIKWTNVWRTAEGADSIQVRKCSDGVKLEKSEPYKDTRKGAEKTNNPIAASDTSRTSHHSQKSESIRNMVWPTDIFGNRPNPIQQISHLLPAGQTHKEWMHMAASVVGSDKDGAPDVWKKAARGYKKKTTTTGKKQPKGRRDQVSSISFQTKLECPIKLLSLMANFQMPYSYQP
ncbi:PLC-like phosphodiesterase, TIM beta/alpha-barrel-containing protein domain containing protein [Nitzschia inconspicua]|uniref:PLC-like phosphodiesterase, TIM beta/alpha-barrel-containing protein domain containing protein n=1 Tax=Nitzschia inconspicua TaxID=303405 RepID=A0A9K3P7Q0_9STRA|nr:PLC-like phosphodiesterase, TIM beta/alpha-barrel-containing protein domain containing protein [Nitzschia inconspicua]